MKLAQTIGAVLAGILAIVTISPSARSQTNVLRINDGYRLTCSSVNYQDTLCNDHVSVGSHSSVMLLRQLSTWHSDGRGSCRRGLDWEAVPGLLFVSNGCRAEFVLYDIEPLPSRSLQCESWDYEEADCFVFLPPNTEVSIARQLSREHGASRGSCRSGVDWGLGNHSIWVKNGCRALFWEQQLP